MFQRLYLLAAGITCALSAHGQTPWREIRNWSNHPCHTDKQWIEPVDRFLFTESSDLAGPPAYGPPILMADPTVAWLKGYGASTGAYYISGSDSNVALGNFTIYRSDNLARFKAVRTAFDEGHRAGRLLRFGNKVYSFLQSPQIFLDPNESDGPYRKIYLMFAANRSYLTEGAGGGNTYDFDEVQHVAHWDMSRRGTETINPIFPTDDYYRDSVIARYGHPEDETDFEGDVWKMAPEVFGASIYATPATGDSGTTRIDANRKVYYDVLFQATQFVSTYMCEMLLSDFLDPESTEYFSEPRKIGYFDKYNDLHFDGGWRPSENTAGGTRTNYFIPTSLDSGDLYFDGLGETEPDAVLATYWFDATVTSGERYDNYTTRDGLDWYQPFGMAHRNKTTSTPDYYPWSSATAISDGSFMFFDKAIEGLKQPFLLYGWRDIGAVKSCSGGGCSDDAIYRGNHVGYAAMDPSQLDIVDYVPPETSGGGNINAFWNLFFGFSYYNPIEYESWAGHYYNNGLGDHTGDPAENGWRVAETPAAFYDESRETYYAFASRNLFSSPGYCIVYRAGEGSTFHTMEAPSLIPSSLTEPDEYMLISSKVAWSGGVADRRNFVHTNHTAGRSYGMGEVFYMRNPNGSYILDDHDNKIPIIAFSVKFDGEDGRTVFFKRLHWDADDNTESKLFRECVDRSADLWSDTLRSEIPYCGADINLDGTVDIGDWFEFFNQWDWDNGTCGEVAAPAGNPSVDFTGTPLDPRDDEVGLEDLYFFLAAYDNGCNPEIIGP